MSSRSSSVALVFASYRSTPHFSLRSSPLPSPPSGLSTSSNASNTSNQWGLRGLPEAPASDSVILYMPPPSRSGSKFRSYKCRPVSPSGRQSIMTPAEQLEVDSATAARERSWPMLHGNILVPSRFLLVTLRHVESPSDGKHVPTREGELFKFKNKSNLKNKLSVR